MPLENVNRRLSAQDASFLYMERQETPLHIGSIAVFEGDIPYERVLANIESKLHLIRAISSGRSRAVRNHHPQGVGPVLISSARYASRSAAGDRHY
jgi:hypothetical protein